VKRGGVVVVAGAFADDLAQKKCPVEKERRYPRTKAEMKQGKKELAKIY
jgi:hypothetical protein